MNRKASCGSEKKETPPNKKCGRAPTGLCGGIHLRKKLCMHFGEDPKTSQMWRKKQDNWPRINQDLEGLSYISDLHHLHIAFLLIQDTRTTLWVCLYLASELDKQTLFLCAHRKEIYWDTKRYIEIQRDTLCCVSKNKLNTCLYSFGLLETFLLSNPGPLCF